MNQTVKLVLYVVLVGALAGLGFGLYSNLRAPSTSPSTSKAPAVSVPTPVPTTNAVSLITNEAGVVTNTASAAITNAVMTNAVATGAVAASSEEDDPLAPRTKRNLGRITAYAVAMFFVVIGLGFLVAHDVSRFLGTRVENFIFNDNLEGMKDPEYEEAERVWSTGDHLEAVRLMRTYLNKHPREQYVALRIAEIYETDLRNYLAAALEYEEVLKKKLPPERWGWAAIHLANLYSGRLDKVEEATKLLRRIVDEYGQTAAAKKARERLGLPEPTVEAAPAAPAAPIRVEIAPKATAAAAEPVEEKAREKDEPPSHNLPPGFRPK